MLDIKYIKENPEDVIERLARKGKDAREDIARILELDGQRRAMIAETEALKAEQNKVSKEIPKLKKEGKDVAPIFAEMKELSDKAKANDLKLRDIETEYMNLMLALPNLPDPDLKPGEKENNEPIRYFGEPHKFDFPPKHHVDLCLDVATRVNNIDGDVFKITAPYIPKIGARVMSLVSPENKMSKSDKDPNGTVYLLDRPEDIMRKFKKAVTDSDTERCVRYDLANKPGVSNLMSIYSACTGKTFEEIEAEFDGKGYGAFKPAVGEAVVETLRPIREESERLLKDKAYLESVYKAGAEKASYIANKTLRKVYKKVGFVAK